MPQAGGSGLFSLAVAVVIVAGLYFGRDVLVPLALAVLLSFALAPPVRWLRRLRVPRLPAVVAVVMVAFCLIGGIAGVIGWQIADLAQSLPRYQSNVESKLQSLRETPPGGQSLARLASLLQRLNEQMDGEEEGAQVPGEPPAEADQDAAAGDEPILVRIAPPELEPMALVRTIIGPLVPPLATAGIVIVFVIFMLMQRDDLRDRLIRLAGTRDLQRTTRALDDAAKRVGHYLLMQLIINATYAIPVAVGLYFIGVPNPLLWGLLAMILRFVPYIGPIVAAAFPLLLAVAVDPGWTTLLWVAALFIILELISNNIMEPVLYGASTGLSPVAIIVAAIFWTWLWGPVGLLLSTPLTVCFVVLGRHVPQLAFLDVILGNEPVLSPTETLYQRLLVGDPDQATERAEEYLAEHRLITFYDEVAVPALTLAEHDRAEGKLDEERREVVASSMFAVLENLDEHEDPAPEDLAEDEPDDSSAEIGISDAAEKGVVLVAGARGNLDDAAATMLVQLLEGRGVELRNVSYELMRPENLATLDLSGVRMICLSYMNSESLAHARYLVRRLRRRAPDIRIMTCFWMFEEEDLHRRDPAAATQADRVAISIRDAFRQVLEELSAEPRAKNDETPALAEVASLV